MAKSRLSVAIIGSGNIGTDLMIKVMRTSAHLEMGALVGIDPQSDGLDRAQRLGVPVTHEGIEGLLKMPNFGEIRRRCSNRTCSTTANWRRTQRMSHSLCGTPSMRMRPPSRQGTPVWRAPESCVRRARRSSRLASAARYDEVRVRSASSQVRASGLSGVSSQRYGSATLAPW